MQYSRLGHSDLSVSRIALGTMTWGEQNTTAQAFEQLDLAIAAGINFIDAAEMYPVPPRAATYGDTERILGRWLQARGSRDRVIIATKVMSRSTDLDYVRGGNNRLDRNHISRAVDDSLRRLQTDYIDLYQLHWPERSTNCFGKLGYVHIDEPDVTPIAETLRVLGALVDSGKVRHIGVSNETPWGVMQFLRAAELHGLPRIVAIQNPYSLLNRSFEIGLAEVAHREQLGLLAYSPLGFGVLSGKYLDGARPAAARLTLFERFQRYTKPLCEQAARGYVELAQRHGLDPAQMALSYVHSRPFVTSTLVGATTLDQLRSNIDSLTVTLSPAVLEGIELLHRQIPNPAP